jgi:T-complex protein 1 subunit gamma
MLKMLLDPMGGIIITNDGNAILREIDVSHPAAKSMLELARSQARARAARGAPRALYARGGCAPGRRPKALRASHAAPSSARAQDEEVGDGTTSVIILAGKSRARRRRPEQRPLRAAPRLAGRPASHPRSPRLAWLRAPPPLRLCAGEMLVVAEPFLSRNMHPTVIVRAYARALEYALEVAEKMATRVELSDAAQMRALIRSCIATKFSARYGDLISDLALAAVRCVTVEEGAGGAKEIDTKRYARVEKIPGGELDECTVLRGVMMEKDVTHPKMRRRIEKPRILLLDCPLEYKKAESATNLEVRRARRVARR